MRRDFFLLIDIVLLLRDAWIGCILELVALLSFLHALNCA